MQSREQFHTNIEEVEQDIVRLAKHTGNVFKQAVDVLLNQDLEQAKEIVENDKLIDKEEAAINDKVVLLIAKQQPVATDLRKLIIALRVVTDIERMADNAKNIARAAIRLGNHGDTHLPNELTIMRDRVLIMLETAISAFQNEDIAVAHKLAEMDDKVDKLYKQVVTDLLSNTAVNAEQVQNMMQIAFTARYMERFADHITNIGESILFLVKGEIVDLND